MNATRFLVPLCLLAAACSQNGASIEILGRAAPSAQPTATSGCTFASGGQAQLGAGVLDVSFTNHLTFDLPLYVNNYLADPAGTESGAITPSKDWSARTVRTRVVNLSDFAPALMAVDAVNVLPFDTTVVKTGGSQVLYGQVVGHALGLQIAAASANLAATENRKLLLGITLRGATQDGAMLDTAEFYYTVDVCNGCLQPPTAATCTAANLTLTHIPSCFPAGQDQQYASCQ